MTRRRWPRNAKVATAVLVVVLLVEVAVLGRDDTSIQAAAATTTTTAATAPASTVTTTTQPPTTSASTVTTVAPPPVSAATSSTVDALTVAPPGPDVGYDRDLFVHWIDSNGDSCDSRCEVLKRQRRSDLAGLPGGGWLSSYDGYTTADSSELDVDHVVPLHEAWLSGAASWDAAMREAFANDLDSPQLLAVTAATNRSKSDKDPANWQPPNRADWCDYASAWTQVKVNWHLTADHDEVNALRNMRDGCPS